MGEFPRDRIFGIETEFGTLVSDPTFGTPESAVELIKDHIFDQKLGALDLHSRDDVFEPSHSGGFLLNGARLYVDAVGSHLEYATAECITLKDVIANDRAGQRMIVRAIKDMGLEDVISVYNNSVDHFGGHTFGCHENYLVSTEDDFINRTAYHLYPFLVTRQIFAGVGRVGGHVLTAEGGLPTAQQVRDNPIDFIWVSHVYGVVPDDTVDFQLSQRADHILKGMASRVRFNRAIINPKWEHYYSHDGMTTRMHILFGEPNQNEYAYALKVGTTCLVLRALEDELITDEVILNHPILALREVSRDPTYRWLVTMMDGESTMTAIDLQRIYLDAAQVYRGESEQTDWILDEWESTLDGLECDPMSMSDRIDWVAKKQIIESYRAEEGLDWNDDALHSVDLEYHNIDPAQSLYGVLPARRLTNDLDIVDAMTVPPQNTRARRRGELVKHVIDKKGPRFYVFDWNGVSTGRHEFEDLSDPYDPVIPLD